MLSHDAAVWYFCPSWDGTVILAISKHYSCGAKAFTVALCWKHIYYCNNMGYTHTHTHTQHIQYALTSYNKKEANTPHFLFLKGLHFDVKKITLQTQEGQKIKYNSSLLNVPGRLNVTQLLYKGISLKKLLYIYIRESNNH